MFAPRPAACPSPAPPTTGNPGGSPTSFATPSSSSPTTEPGADNSASCSLSRPLSRQPADEEGVHVQHPGRPGEEVRLVGAQPEELVEGRGHARRLPRYLVQPVGSVPVYFVVGPRVQPQDRLPQGTADFVRADEALPLVCYAEGLDGASVHPRGGLLEGSPGGRPPVLGILLVPARSGRGEGERRPSLRHGVTLFVPDHSLGRRGRAIDPDDVSCQGHTRRHPLSYAPHYSTLAHRGARLSPGGLRVSC